MSHSHSSGCMTKDSGGISTEVMSSRNGVSVPPTMPMSWCNGSQLSITSPVRNGPPRRIESAAASSPRWLSTTPFASDVVPELNWISVGSSGSVSSTGSAT